MPPNYYKYTEVDEMLIKIQRHQLPPEDWWQAMLAIFPGNFNLFVPFSSFKISVSSRSVGLNLRHRIKQGDNRQSRSKKWLSKSLRQQAQKCGF